MGIFQPDRVALNDCVPPSTEGVMRTDLRLRRQIEQGRMVCCRDPNYTNGGEESTDDDSEVEDGMDYGDYMNFDKVYMYPFKEMSYNEEDNIKEVKGVGEDISESSRLKRRKNKKKNSRLSQLTFKKSTTN